MSDDWGVYANDEDGDTCPEHECSRDACPADCSWRLSDDTRTNDVPPINIPLHVDSVWGLEPAFDGDGNLFEVSFVHKQPERMNTHLPQWVACADCGRMAVIPSELDNRDLCPHCYDVEQEGIDIAIDRCVAEDMAELQAEIEEE